MTGVELPSPSADRDERQAQLKQLVQSLVLKLDPALGIHKLNYVRVIKGPKPSILEVKCQNAERYKFYLRLPCLLVCNIHLQLYLLVYTSYYLCL
jgi:hypothetical protein